MDRSPICFDDTDDDTDDDDDDGDDDIEEYPRALTLSLFQGKTAEPAEFYCFTPLPACLLYTSISISAIHTDIHIHTPLHACYTISILHTHTPLPVIHIYLCYASPLCLLAIHLPQSHHPSDCYTYLSVSLLHTHTHTPLPLLYTSISAILHPFISLFSIGRGRGRSGGEICEEEDVPRWSLIRW